MVLGQAESTDLVRTGSLEIGGGRIPQDSANVQRPVKVLRLELVECGAVDRLEPVAVELPPGAGIFEPVKDHGEGGFVGGKGDLA